MHLLAHEAIHAAIADGNAQLASDKMTAHVLEVETYLSRLKKSQAGKTLWENCLRMTEN